MSEGMEKEVRLEQMDPAMMYTHDRAGEPSVYSCPECGGVLWEIQDGDILRFRCRVGHAFSIESMFAEQGESIESALWAALKTLQENADLSRRMARQAHERKQTHLAQHYEERLHDTNQRIQVIAQALKNGHSTEATDAEAS